MTVDSLDGSAHGYRLTAFSSRPTVVCCVETLRSSAFGPMISSTGYTVWPLVSPVDIFSPKPLGSVTTRSFTSRKMVDSTVFPVRWTVKGEPRLGGTGIWSVGGKGPSLYRLFFSHLTRRNQTPSLLTAHCKSGEQTSERQLRLVGLEPPQYRWKDDRVGRDMSWFDFNTYVRAFREEWLSLRSLVNECDLENSLLTLGDWFCHLKLSKTDSEFYRTIGSWFPNFSSLSPDYPEMAALSWHPSFTSQSTPSPQ